MKFNVGQIIYILSKKETKVFPAMIVEEICRKTVEKENTSYTVLLPDKGRSEVLIEDIDADIFASLKDAENKMKKCAAEQIEKILLTAKKMESIFQDDTKTINKLDNIEVTVDLGNGVTANLDTESLEA